MGDVLQPGVVAPQRLPDEVLLNKLLRRVGAQLQLEPLPETIRRRHHARREARHLGLLAHHRHKVDNIVGRAAECYKITPLIDWSSDA